MVGGGSKKMQEGDFISKRRIVWFSLIFKNSGMFILSKTFDAS